MKPLKSLFLVVLAGCLTSGFAQDYTFKVMVNKGNSEFNSGSKWEPVKTGLYLNKNDELKIPENAYVGLVHFAGMPLQIKESGRYKVSELAAKVSGGTSVLNKYTDFILSANTEKGNRLQATGAVHRGPGDINLYLPSTEYSTMFNQDQIITWDTQKVKGPYRIEFQSMFGDELAKIETEKGFVQINLGDDKFKNEDNINVTVTSLSEAGKLSGKFILKRLSKGDTDRIKNSLDQLGNVVSSKDALGLYYLAGFYESNTLFIDAITCYQKAIALEPDVYKDYFGQFLIRNGFVKEEEK